MKNLFLSVVLWGLSISVWCQAIGSWQDGFSYHRVNKICLGKPNEIIAAAPNGIFIYNQKDQSVTKLNKTNQLSDVGVSAIHYNNATEQLLLGYSNGNFDRINAQGTRNIADIVYSTIIGDKAIYDIQSYQNLAYLATGIGIVVMDLDRMEVKSTYLIGNQGEAAPILQTIIENDTIYAIGQNFIKFAPIQNPFLANYQLWQNIESLPSSDNIIGAAKWDNHWVIATDGETNDRIWSSQNANIWSEIKTYPEGTVCQNLWFNNQVFSVSKNNGYEIWNNQNQMVFEDNQNLWLYLNVQQTIVDEKNNFWIGNSTFGLNYHTSSGTENMVVPQGPMSDGMRKVNGYNDNVWIATGNIYPWWGNTYNTGSQTAHIAGTWSNIPFGQGGNDFGNAVQDVLDVAIDPTNVQHVLFGSWENGLIEKNSDGSLSYFNAQTNNSPFQAGPFDTDLGWTGVAGLCFDLEGNAWISNSYSSTPLIFYSKEKEFSPLTFSPFVGEADIIDQVIHSQENYVFAVVKGRGILALNYNGTPTSSSDDNYKLLNDKEGEGGLPTKDVYCIAEDLDGALWVGSLRGLSIFYNQSNIFQETGFDAEQIYIEQDGNVQILLETEAINSIEIDGGNNKWIATQKNGVFQFSPDGLKQLAHFTAENSPLPSNTVYDIGINQANGQLYFATDKGLVMFTGSASNFDNEMKDVFAFPNPVSSAYEGTVTIQGLAYESTIHITDTNGQLVYTTKSQGGRATWDGKLSNGDRPPAGIYFVMATNPDGSVDNVTKIAFVK
jgi:ligand-binding sensor domain-containing protein